MQQENKEKAIVANVSSDNNKSSVASKQYTREEAIELFKYAEQLKMESMVEMQKQSQSEDMSMSQMDYTVEMIIQQTMMGDRLFLKHGIEEEDFNRIVAQHQLYNDPEV